jgi:hypothetical protein
MTGEGANHDARGGRDPPLQQSWGLGDPKGLTRHHTGAPARRCSVLRMKHPDQAIGISPDETAIRSVFKAQR